MRKLFLAICFSVVPMLSFAAVNEVFDPSVVSQLSQQPKQKEMVVHNVTSEQLGEFLEERLKAAIIMNKKEITQDNVAFEPSDEVKNKKKEESKSTFEKIYEQALQRVNNNQVKEELFLPSWQEQQLQQIEQFKQNVKTIDIAMPPFNEKETIAAVEHIPYLYNKIEILPDGNTMFNERLVLLTEGKNTKKNLVKKLPRYVFDRNGKKIEIKYALASVYINGTPVDYKISEKFSEVWFEPVVPQNMEAGVYQYEFSYMAGNLVNNYGELQEFYFNLSGSGWDYIIAKMGANIYMPARANVVTAFSLMGYENNLQNDNIKASVLDNNVIGFTSNIPLFLKEGMHLSVFLKNDGVVVLSKYQKMSQYFDNNLEVIIAFMALFFIAGAYALSWISIKKNKTKLVAKLKKSPEMIRLLYKGFYDFKNFAVFLLSMYKKNIIDIQQSGETVILVKRTDDTKKLTKDAKKAIGEIFGKYDAVFKVDNMNLLKVKRAAKCLRNNLRKQLLFYALKANGAYLLLSLFMFFMALSAIVYLKSLGSFAFLSLLFIFAFTIISGCFFYSKPKNVMLNILLKVVSFFVVSLMWLLASAYMNVWAALLLLNTCLTISFFTLKFARRDGLLANTVKENKKLVEYIMDNKDSMSKGREFLNQQPLIFALDLEDEFQAIGDTLEHNKTTAMKQILKLFM